MANPYAFGTYSEATKELQRQLTEHGFDTQGEDGIFGRNTRDAVEAAQHHFGISPPDGVPRADLLSFLGITPPAPAPRSNPITDYLSQIAIKALLANLLKGSAMTFLSGYKTYVVGIASILLGLIAMLGWAVPPLPTMDAGQGWQLVLTGLGLLGLRAAIGKA